MPYRTLNLPLVLPFQRPHVGYLLVRYPVLLRQQRGVHVPDLDPGGGNLGQTLLLTSASQAGHKVRRGRHHQLNRPVQGIVSLAIPRW